MIIGDAYEPEQLAPGALDWFEDDGLGDPPPTPEWLIARIYCNRGWMRLKWRDADGLMHDHRADLALRPN